MHLWPTKGAMWSNVTTAFRTQPPVPRFVIMFSLVHCLCFVMDRMKVTPLTKSAVLDSQFLQKVTCQNALPMTWAMIRSKKHLASRSVPFLQIRLPTLYRMSLVMIMRPIRKCIKLGNPDNSLEFLGPILAARKVNLLKLMREQMNCPLLKLPLVLQIHWCWWGNLFQGNVGYSLECPATFHVLMYSSLLCMKYPPLTMASRSTLPFVRPMPSPALMRLLFLMWLSMWVSWTLVKGNLGYSLECPAFRQNLPGLMLLRLALWTWCHTTRWKFRLLHWMEVILRCMYPLKGILAPHSCRPRGVHLTISFSLSCPSSRVLWCTCQANLCSDSRALCRNMLRTLVLFEANACMSPIASRFLAISNKFGPMMKWFGILNRSLRCVNRDERITWGASPFRKLSFVIPCSFKVGLTISLPHLMPGWTPT